MILILLICSSFVSLSLAQYSGDLTFYYPAGGYGACGTPLQNNDMICALSFAQHAEIGCDACMEVTGPLGKVVVRVMDKCEGCKYGDVDLAYGAFIKIANEVDGRVKGTSRVVDCKSGTALSPPSPIVFAANSFAPSPFAPIIPSGPAPVQDAVVTEEEAPATAQKLRDTTLSPVPITNQPAPASVSSSSTPAATDEAKSAKQSSSTYLAQLISQAKLVEEQIKSYLASIATSSSNTFAASSVQMKQEQSSTAMSSSNKVDINERYFIVILSLLYLSIWL